MWLGGGRGRKGIQLENDEGGRRRGYSRCQFQHTDLQHILNAPLKQEDSVNRPVQNDMAVVWSSHLEGDALHTSAAL